MSTSLDGPPGRKAETLDAPGAYAAAGVPMRTAELEAAVASDPA